MGDSVANIYPNAHYHVINGTPVLQGLKLAVHHGGGGVSLTTLDHEATGSGLAAVVAASKVSNVAFASACATEWPNSWGLPFTGYVGELRAVVAALP